MIYIIVEKQYGLNNRLERCITGEYIVADSLEEARIKFDVTMKKKGLGYEYRSPTMCRLKSELANITIELCESSNTEEVYGA